MLRDVVQVFHPPNGRTNLVLRCGHITTRESGHVWKRVHCARCEYHTQIRDEKAERRARKAAKKAARKRKQQLQVERLMAKKKKAKKTKKTGGGGNKKSKSKKVSGKKSKSTMSKGSREVPAKKDLAKFAKSKSKRKKSKKLKTGTKWFFVPKLYAPKKTVLKRIIVMFRDSEDAVLGENEIVRAMEAAGVKDEGNKTVKKQVKAVLRNMSRSGLIVKERNVKNIPELSDEPEDDDEEVEDDDESEDDDDNDDDEDDDE